MDFVKLAKTPDLRLRQQLRMPQFRAGAYADALQRIQESPDLAMAILARNNFTRHDKLAAVTIIRERMEYTRPLFMAAGTNRNQMPVTEMAQLPPFFRLLSRQRTRVIEEVCHLWAIANNEFGSPRGRPYSTFGNFAIQAEQYVQSFSSGYNVVDREVVITATSRASQTFTVYGYNDKEKPDGPAKFVILATGCRIGNFYFNYEFQP